MLYTFSQTNASGENMDGADCYEPLVEPRPGVFYGDGFHGGNNASGVVFRYSNWNPGQVEIIHDFSALNSAGQNWDGADTQRPAGSGTTWDSRLEHQSGGANGSGVLYNIREDGHFEVLHTFSATNPKTGANDDGAFADEGLIADGNKLIGIAEYGGNGSPAGYKTAAARFMK